LSKDYHSKGLVVYRINSKESNELITTFLGKNPLSVPTLLDKTGKTGKLFGLWAHPTSYLIDREGMVRYRAVGAVDWIGLEATSVIDILLKVK
jgi:hypothetical protein